MAVALKSRFIVQQVVGCPAQGLLLLDKVQRHLVSQYLVAAEVFNLSTHLRGDVRLVQHDVKSVLFAEDPREILHRHVWLIFVPQEDFLEPLTSLEVELHLHGDEGSELILRLVKEGVVFKTIIRLLERVELGKVHRVDPRLRTVEVVEVFFD